MDRKILRLLQRDVSLSAAQVGEQVGLSQAAAWRRINRLEEEGVIAKRVAVVDGEKVGMGTTVLALVRLSAQGRANLDSFIAAIEKMPNVLECFVLMGDDDFFLKVAVSDVFEYQDFFFRTLSTLEGVAEVKSRMTLSKIKNDTALPL